MDLLVFYEVLRSPSLIQQYRPQLQVNAVLYQRDLHHHQAPLPVAVGPVFGLVLQPQCSGQPQEDVVIDDSRTGGALARLAKQLESLRTPLLEIAEYLHQSTGDRARRQVGPDGSPWAPLSPRTLARKKSGGKILRETGALLDTLRRQVSDNELYFGADRPYRAIHQFCAKVEHAARYQQVRFKMSAEVVGNRFVKKKHANFNQWVTHGARSVEMPACPYLGLSVEDDAEVLAIISDYLTAPLVAD